MQESTESRTEVPLLVLVAGPYRSGTDDVPERLAANVEAMNRAALDVFRAGHTPLTGEALALPLIELAGSERVGDAVFDEIFHPIARRLLDRCDAVLRVGGPSAGADEMVQQARDAGKLVATDVAELP
jgi:molybdopterin biosynthesis enzyme